MHPLTQVYTLQANALAPQDIAFYGRNVVYTRNVRRKFMLYQYKREPLNNDEVDKLTNSCDTFREKFVIWPLLNTSLTLS